VLLLLGVFWNNNPHHYIWDETRQPTRDEEYDREDADDYRIDIEIFCETAANASDFAVFT